MNGVITDKSMRRYNIKHKDLLYLAYRWIDAIIDPDKLIRGIPNVYRFFRDWITYSKMKGAEPISLINSCPSVNDKTELHKIDRHYFFQDIWAFKKIHESRCERHVDIGSKIYFIGFVTAVTKVTFIDIRPIMVSLENFESKPGSILSVPYESNSIVSLSCLHVAEHIGLGRYGDELDPLGTRKACRELSRVLAPGGNLYFSLPIGRPRLCFNAHRIHAPQQILDYFFDLRLVELSGVDDTVTFIRNIDIKYLESCDYGCGLFWFVKE